MSANFSHDRIIRYASELIWNFFNDTIKESTLKSTDDNKIKVETVIVTKLKDAGFDYAQCEMILDVFDNNLIGESILDIVDLGTIYRIIGFGISLESNELTDYQLLDKLRDFGIDSTTLDADEVLKMYQTHYRKVNE